MDLPISFSLCAVMDLPIYKKWVVLDLSISFLWVVMDLSISFSLCVVMDLSIYKKVGSDGFEPPKARASRFTVCPIWPLW